MPDEIPTSVVIPTFNRAEYLLPCIEAVLTQTLPPAEVIVVVDGSTDGTKSVVDRFGTRVRYFYQENSGKAAALNSALERISHPLVWIVDDDDIVCPEALETLTGLLTENPGADFAYGRHLRFEEGASTGKRRLLPTGHWYSCAPGDFFVTTLEDFFVHQPGMLVRRDLYDRVGPFDATLVRSQDYEMLIRLARAGTCVSTDSVVFLQRRHSGRRGSAGARFEASESTQKWVEVDQQIFRRLYGELSLGEYLPGRPQSLGEAERRQGLLQRGVVMARKKLWSLAVADFTEAAQLGATPLAPREKAILRRAFSSKFGCEEVIDDVDVRTALIGCCSGATNGRRVRAALAAGLRWRIREASAARRFGDAMRLLVLWLALNGYVGKAAEAARVEATDRDGSSRSGQGPVDRQAE
jgi:glycosyltransferase involved in cell wall biosynthesis